MSTQDTDLSSLPPATLRAALDASEKRVRREKEQIQREIRKLQKRLDELEEGEGAPEPEKNVAGRSRRKATKRPRVDSSSEDEVVEERYGRWPIAKARRADPGPAPPPRPSCTKCRMRGVSCDWDEIRQRCLPCQRSHFKCDLKRPTSTGTDAELSHKILL